MEQYKGLWQVEQTFRITKHNLEICPIYHFVDRRIKAHFAICYIALTLVRTLEVMMHRNNCYIPIEQLLQLLQRVIVTRIISKGYTYDITQDFPSELVKIYRCVKTKIPNRFRSWVK